MNCATPLRHSLVILCPKRGSTAFKLSLKDQNLCGSAAQCLADQRRCTKQPAFKRPWYRCMDAPLRTTIKDTIRSVFGKTGNVESRGRNDVIEQSTISEVHSQAAPCCDPEWTVLGRQADGRDLAPITPFPKEGERECLRDKHEEKRALRNVVVLHPVSAEYRLAHRCPLRSQRA